MELINYLIYIIFLFLKHFYKKIRFVFIYIYLYSNYIAQIKNKYIKILLLLLLFIHSRICQPVGRLAAGPIQLLGYQLGCQAVYIKLNTGLTLYIIPFPYSYVLPELSSDILTSIFTVDSFITVDYFYSIDFVILYQDSIL